MIASNQRTYNIYSFAFVIVVEHVSSISVKQSATAYIWIIHIEVNFFVFIIHAAQFLPMTPVGRTTIYLTLTLTLSNALPPRAPC